MSEDPADTLGQSSDRPPPGADDVRSAMQRICSASEFAQSPRMQKFLGYIIQESLAGRADKLKEYSIALEVFDRPDSFDPQTSSVVRVEASRLRAKLEHYAHGEGRMDPVRISVPAGGYVPSISWADPPPVVQLAGEAGRAPEPPGARMRLARALAALVIMAVGIAGLATLFGGAPVGWLTGRDVSQVAPVQGSSLAVLPLRDLSSTRDDDYFSIGMTDALITRLAQLDVAPVTSMTSVMRYQGEDRNLELIARELGVSHIVEGSVLKIGDKVRITAQLVDVASDTNLWADNYERNFVDVIAMQDEVARQISGALGGRIAGVGRSASAVPPGIDPAAYQAHMRGRYFLSQMTEDGFRKGLSAFRQAIARAPEFAPAHSGMASCFCLLGGHGLEIVVPNEGMPLARDAAVEAMRLDPTLAEPHAFLGIIRLKYEWDWNGAEAALRKAIDLNPNLAQARLFYSFYLEAMGRQDVAVREAEIASSLDPVGLATSVNLGWQYLQAGEFGKAEAIFKETAEIDGDFWGVHWGLGQLYRLTGDDARAVRAFEAAIAAQGGHALPIRDLGYTHALAGRTDAAMEVLDSLSKLAKLGYVSPVNMAIVHAGLGNTDEAFSYLEQAFDDRSRAIAWLNVTEEFDGLRDDPRFDDLRRRIGLP